VATVRKHQLMNILTIDIEDWYHCLESDPARWHAYEDRVATSTSEVLRILAVAHTKATFFVLGDVARRHPELVREIHQQGHEVACHGCQHRFVYQQTPAQFEADVREGIERLSEITGQPVRGYRAPYFSITRESLWALDILRALGIAYDSSIFPVVNHRYGIPSAQRLIHQVRPGLVELPLATFPLRGVNVPCGGGVYFRGFPYALTRNMFHRLNARGERVVFYLHPWEFDFDQPRIALPPALRLRHYWRLRKTAAKFARLLHDFSFGSVQEALGL
jgi:polysaccharide deacetylase family protein (PEP-CTERM system associated)